MTPAHAIIETAFIAVSIASLRVMWPVVADMFNPHSPRGDSRPAHGKAQRMKGRHATPAPSAAPQCEGAVS